MTELAPVTYTPFDEANSPRCVVVLNGSRYVAQSYTFAWNGHGATDTATVVLSLTGNPDWTVDLASTSNAPVFASLYAGFPTTFNPEKPGLEQLYLRFSGVVDNYTAHIDASQDTVSFECRSLAAPLTSTKITTPFAGESMLTGQFIQEQAARFGLGVSINTVSQGTLLDVLGSEFVTGVRNWVLWDLMLQCAQYDDVDLWVDKHGVLHYEAASLINRSSLVYYWGTNVQSIDASHAVQFSKNIQVEVRSYTKRTKVSTTSRVVTNPSGGVTTSTSSRVVTSSPVFGTNETIQHSISNTGQSTSVATTLSAVTGGGANSGGTGYLSDSGKEKYVFYLKNATPQQCDDQARKIWRQISMHEYATNIVLPVTHESLPVLDITTLISIMGAPMRKINTQYWPRRISESFSVTEGWLWSIEAVNHELPQGSV